MKPLVICSPVGAPFLGAWRAARLGGCRAANLAAAPVCVDATETTAPAISMNRIMDLVILAIRPRHPSQLIEIDVGSVWGEELCTQGVTQGLRRRGRQIEA